MSRGPTSSSPSSLRSRSNPVPPLPHPRRVLSLRLTSFGFHLAFPLPSVSSSSSTANEDEERLGDLRAMRVEALADTLTGVRYDLSAISMTMRSMMARSARVLLCIPSTQIDDEEDCSRLARALPYPNRRVLAVLW
ncbi:unnamed protein product [Urochloa humidicola]